MDSFFLPAEPSSFFSSYLLQEEPFLSPNQANHTPLPSKTHYTHSNRLSHMHSSSTIITHILHFTHSQSPHATRSTDSSPHLVSSFVSILFFHFILLFFPVLVVDRVGALRGGFHYIFLVPLADRTDPHPLPLLFTSLLALLSHISYLQSRHVAAIPSVPTMVLCHLPIIHPRKGLKGLHHFLRTTISSYN